MALKEVRASRACREPSEEVRKVPKVQQLLAQLVLRDHRAWPEAMACKAIRASKDWATSDCRAARVKSVKTEIRAPRV